MPTRARPGIASFSSASRFGTISWTIVVIPVTFAPGRESDATIFSFTGSTPETMTIGMVFVALLMATVAVLPTTTMTSGFSRTSSSTIAASCA